MKTETYQPEKKHTKTIIFLAFLLIVLALLYFAFSNKISNTSKLTGFVTQDAQKTSLTISTDLTIPAFETTEKASNLEIQTGISNNIILIGDKKIDISEIGDSKIIIENYNGKLSLAPSGKLKLDGNAAKVLINNLPISQQKESTMKISISEFSFSSLKIRDASINSLSYPASGTIKINEQSTININEEKVEISGFKGALEITGDRFKLNGNANKLNILGKSAISVR